MDGEDWIGLRRMVSSVMKTTPNTVAPIQKGFILAKDNECTLY